MDGPTLGISLKKVLFFSCLVAALGRAEFCFAQEVQTEIKGSSRPGVTVAPPTPTETLPFNEEPDDRVFFGGRQTDVRTEMSRMVEVPDGPGLRLGLKDCVQMALLNNREIKAKNYDIEVAENKLREAQPRGVPVINYEFLSAPAPRDVDNAVKSLFEGDITFLERGKIEMGIPLLSFGKIRLAQGLARTGIAAEKERKVSTQNETVLKTKKLYYGILLARDVEDLLQDAVKHLTSEVQRRESTEGNKNEPSDPVDLVKLKLFRYEILRRLAETQKKGYLAKEGLRIQMGMEKPVNFEPIDQHLAPVEFDLKQFEEYLKASQQFRPENRLLDLGVQAKEMLYRLEKRKLAPDIGVGGFYEFGRTTNSITGLQLTDDFNDPFNFSRAGFGLRVKGEINLKGYLAKVKQAQAEYFKSAVQKHQADEGLELDLKESFLSVIQALQGVQETGEARKLARQYVFLTKTNVDIGVGEKKDYSDALQAYLVARGRYLEAVFDYNIAVATLEQKVGGPAQPQ
jgi:Outer membrane protein